MSEEEQYEFTTRDWVVLAGLVITVIGGFSTMICLGYFASNSAPGALLAAVIAAASTATSAIGTAYYANQRRTPEDRLLTYRQRREIRHKRGAVVMEKALIEVEHERDNIVHNRMLEAADPDKPPFKTQWSPQQEEWGRILNRPEPQDRRYDKDR